VSTHSVNVIEIAEVHPHENAERLEIVPVGGWQAVVKKGQFKPGDRAVYIQPDYTVPTALEEFSFLHKPERDRHRLKAVRLRGVLSYGLLIPVPERLNGRNVGADVMEDLGIERYEPPVVNAGADDLPTDQWPDVYASKFDVESLQNYPDVLKIGEPVIVTEKIHGANARYLYSNGVFYMGSRTRWLRPNANHIWSRAAISTPPIERFCESHPGTVLYGEVYGSVQSLKYGARPGEVSFAAFAALSRGEWVDLADVFDDPLYPAAPVLYRGPYDPDIVLPLAERDSTVPGAPKGHMREGIVIVPEVERRDDAIGRVALKHISNRYWEGEA
jgi:RNA ligase (TIGR02306 family)